MYRCLFIKNRIISVNIIGEDIFYQLCGFRFGKIQVVCQCTFCVAGIHFHQSTVAECLCECQCMCRNVNFRNDVDTDRSGIFDQAAELIFCIIKIGRCCSLTFFIFYRRFQTESRVSIEAVLQTGCCICIPVVLKEDQVIIQMYLKVVHFVPGHRCCNIFYRLKLGCFSSDVKDHTSDLVFRIVSCRSFRDRCFVLLQDLQEGSGCPVSTCCSLGFCFDGISDL